MQTTLIQEIIHDCASDQESPHNFTKVYVITRRRRLLILLQCGVNALNPGPICIVCNSTGKKNQLYIKCTKCAQPYHRTCTEFTTLTYPQFHKAVKEASWICSSCKTTKNQCSICELTNNTNCTKCNTCNNYFHSKCVKEEFPQYKCDTLQWVCPHCATQQVYQSPDISDHSFSTELRIARGIPIGHLNVRDLLASNKKDDVTNLVLNVPFHIFGVSETWLFDKVCDEEVTVPGYQIIRSDRKNIKSHKTRGGGVLLYVRDDYSVTVLNNTLQSQIDSLHVVVNKEFLPPIHIILIYNPPKTATKHLINYLKCELDASDQQEIYIMGDINIDLLKSDADKLCFASLMEDYHLHQLIKKPTRLTQSTKSLIDIIYTNKPLYNKCSNVVPETISDHCLIYTVRKKERTKKCQTKTVKLRTFKDTNNEKLKQMIKSAPWWILDFPRTVSEQYELFMKIINFVLDIHAPIKTFRVKAMRKPWMNAEYTRLNNIQRRQLKKAMKTNETEDWAMYKSQRNQMTNLKHVLKSTTISKAALESGSPSKTFWRFLNQEVGRQKVHTELPDFKLGTKIIDNEQDKLNLLCETFSQNPANLKCQVKLPTEDLEESYEDDLCDIQVSVKEVLKSISELEQNKPSGHDNIPPKFFKICADEIAPILTKIINAMFKKGEFPDALKIALVHPLYKQKGEKCHVKNYRPISILTSAAKIIERVLYKHVSSHLENNDMFMAEQHGYRKNRSTQSAVLVLTDDIKTASDQKKLTGVVFVDFEQAFDRLQYDEFLCKLKACGVRGNVLKLFKSYFEDRKIIVKKGSQQSKPFYLKQGTPQGSALSGMTFSIYLNDIKDYLTESECKFIFYADDMAIYTHADTAEELESKLQLAVNKLTDWCTNNKMSIHVGKTKAMIFKTKYQKCTHQLQIKINQQLIENVTEFKYLGLTLNCNLSFDKHYEKTCKSMTNRMYLLKRQKKHFPEKWRLIFATSLILSLLEYCLPVWGNLSKTKAERINKIIIKTANCVVLNQAFRSKRQVDKYSVLEKLNWLTVEERLVIYSVEFVKKNVLNPKSSLQQCFGYFQAKSNDSNSTRTGRNSYDFMLPRMNTEFGKTTFYYRTIQMWNKLPNEIKEIQAFSGFDYKLRQNIIQKRQDDFTYY